MARARTRAAAQPLPAPLPPEKRTVGQLVAESIRLYGRRFWAAVPLGLVVATADALGPEAPRGSRMLVLVAFAPLFTLAYARATTLVLDISPPLRAWAGAVAAGTVAFLPAAVLFPWFAIAAVAWLAFVGLVVPVALSEQRGFSESFLRAVRLAKADYVHALGSLATLVILFGVTRLILALLLNAQADNTVRAAVAISDVVLSPLLFLGSAMLYVDQAARLEARERRESETSEVR
jgi:hypothetical protein